MAEWLSVAEYANKVGRTRQQVYLDIRLGKIPQTKVRQIKIKHLIEIQYDRQTRLESQHINFKKLTK